MSEYFFELDSEVGTRCRYCGITPEGARWYGRQECRAAPPPPPPADDAVAEALKRMPVGFDAIDKAHRK